MNWVFRKIDGIKSTSLIFPCILINLKSSEEWKSTVQYKIRSPNLPKSISCRQPTNVTVIYAEVPGVVLLVSITFSADVINWCGVIRRVGTWGWRSSAAAELRPSLEMAESGPSHPPLTATVITARLVCSTTQCQCQCGHLNFSIILLQI